MTHFLWSTYSNDGDCCLQSILAVLDLGISPDCCHVSVQRGKPLPASIVDQMTSLGVDVTEGRYTRRDTYFDAVAKLRSFASIPADLVWHLDSDVILNDFAVPDSLLSGESVAMAAAWKGCEFSGCSTIVSVSAAKACLKDMLENNSAGLPHTGVPDDVMIGKVLDAVCGSERVVRLPSSVLGWYVFDRDWEKMAKAQWVHFGQKSLAREHAKGIPVRSMIAQHMKEYREWKASTTL